MLSLPRLYFTSLFYHTLSLMIRTLIIDDEWHARLILRGLLEEHFPIIDIVGEAKDVPEAVKMIHKHQPELLFLDVEMPNYSGLELFQFLPPNSLNFKVIFVTAYNDYAIKAFELSAVDYILKPAQRDTLQRAIDKVNKHIVSNTSIATPANELQLLQDNFTANNTQQQKIALSTSEGTVIVHIKDIMYLRADGSYTYFILANNNKILVSKRIAEFDKLEEIGDFLRVHRSYTVNLHHVHKITKAYNIILENGEEFSVSEDKRLLLNNWVNSRKI